MHLLGDIADLAQDFGLHPRALTLFRPGVGQEPLRHEILLGRRHGLFARHHAMMIGEYEAILADDRGGAPARQPHRRITHLLEPGLIGRETVAGFYPGGGEVVEGPHTLIGVRRPGSAERGTQYEADDRMAWHALGLLSLLGCHWLPPFLPPRARCSIFCGARAVRCGRHSRPETHVLSPAAAGEAIPPIACGMHGGTTS